MTVNAAAESSQPNMKPTLEIAAVAANDKCYNGYVRKPAVTVTLRNLTRQQAVDVSDAFSAAYDKRVLDEVEACSLSNIYMMDNFPLNYVRIAHFSTMEEASAFADKMTDMLGIEGVNATLIEASRAVTANEAARGGVR